VVAWDVAEVESAEIAAELVQRACLKERYCRPRGFGSRQSHQQTLILHADNGNAMRAATLESRLEELGVLRSFSRPRVSNDNPYSESLFRTAKYRPDYPSRPFASKAEACEWVAAFVDWYNHRHRHSGMKFVTPHQPPQRCRHRNLPGTHPGLRKGSPGPPKTLEPIHSLLAPTSSGVDQQATRWPPIQSGATIYPSSLKGSQGVTPFLKVTGTVARWPKSSGKGKISTAGWSALARPLRTAGT
jgi:hypothetical protein